MMFGIQLGLAEERRSEMKFICLNDQNISIVNKSIVSFIGSLASSSRFLHMFSLNAQVKKIVSCEKNWDYDVYASVLEISSCGYDLDAFDNCVEELTSKSKVCYEFKSTAKTAVDGGIGIGVIRQLYVGKRMVEDWKMIDPPEDEDVKPLEYHFAKEFLSQSFMARDLYPELDIEIDERYDLNNYESRIKKAFKEANTTLD